MRGAGRYGSEGRRTRMTLITDAGVPATAEELCERLGQVSAELSALTQSAFASFGHQEAAAVVAGVERVTRGVEALQHQCAGGIESGKAWNETGYRSFSRWWSVHTHRRQHTSNAIRLLARDLRDRLPLTAAALQAERLGVEHARVLAAYTKTEAQREQLLDEEMGEAFLVAQAAQMDVDVFSRVVKAWAVRTDPEAADRRWREQSAQRELFLSQVLDGTDIRGWLGHEEGQLVEEVLKGIIGVPAAEDERTPAQRRADALVQLCRSHLDAGTVQPGARVRPHIAITVDLATLERLVNATGPGASTCRQTSAFGGAVPPGGQGVPGPSSARVVIPAGIDHDQLGGLAPATFADGTPIPYGQLAKLLCDGEFHRVVFGPEGQVLDSGRTERLFTPAQARAIIARDRHCQYPGCAAPPGIGEIHHCLWWYHGGHTSTDNAILLCWWHHTLVHQRHLTITRHCDEHSPAQWMFTTPDGHPVQVVPPPADTFHPGHQPAPEPPRRE